MDMLDVILGSWGTEVEKRKSELCTHAAYIAINTLFICVDRSRKICIFISEGFDTEFNSVRIFFIFPQNGECSSENVCLIQETSTIALRVFQLHIYFLECFAGVFPVYRKSYSKMRGGL